MPSVDLKPETFSALSVAAARTGQDVSQLAEFAVAQFLCTHSMTTEEYRAAWDQLLAEIRSQIPAGISQEQIERDIDAATDEVWAERRARSH